MADRFCSRIRMGAGYHCIKKELGEKSYVIYMVMVPPIVIVPEFYLGLPILKIKIREKI